MTKILGVGGGSGGHVTPVVAVFKELEKLDQDNNFYFWCDKKFAKTAKTIFAKYDKSIQVNTIVSGKFRRYHGISKWHYFYPSILIPNIIDFFAVIIGFFQSLYLLWRLKPDVIFMKGGYVCLPVGYAARFLKIPTVLHDSDAHPGLTNRLLSPFAEFIGTGAPLKYYNYPKGKAKYVGIPVLGDFRKYSEQERADFKQKLGFDKNKPLVVVTGGGLGAAKINNAILDVRQKLLAHTSVMLISGDGQFAELTERLKGSKVYDNWQMKAFIHQGMAQVLAAADIVITRAGATTLLELAGLHKPTIIIPNGILTAGHQMKNAKVYQDSLAAVIITEDELSQNNEILTNKVLQILKAPKIRKELGDNFGKFAKPHAALDMAKIIQSVINKV